MFWLSSWCRRRWTLPLCLIAVSTFIKVIYRNDVTPSCHTLKQSRSQRMIEIARCLHRADAGGKCHFTTRCSISSLIREVHNCIRAARAMRGEGGGRLVACTDVRRERLLTVIGYVTIGGNQFVCCQLTSSERRECSETRSWRVSAVQRLTPITHSAIGGCKIIE